MALNRGPADFGPVLLPDFRADFPRPRARSIAMARRLRLDRNDPTGKRRLVFVDSRHTRIHDVICAGMYRACSTWQYEVVGHLIERHLRGERLGYLTGEAYAARFAPCSRREVHADVGRRSWRVLKSHEGHRCFAGASPRGRHWPFMRIATSATWSSR